MIVAGLVFTLLFCLAGIKVCRAARSRQTIRDNMTMWRRARRTAKGGR